MAIKQFVVSVIYEHAELDEEGREHRGGQLVDVDLVTESVEEFLARIPDDINEHSVLMVTITRPDGRMISFADGITMLDTEAGPDAPGAYRRLYQFEDNYDDRIRHTSGLFASRRLRPTDGASQAGPTNAAEPAQSDD
ncbi:MAG TPA: hypothetical protein VFJ58_29530 [Armatimonadota bacterium]|nr:hypothetical protein [Armatimonadota bacterium]